MAITALTCPVWIPNPTTFGSSGAPGYGSAITLNASGDKMAFVIQAPKAGDLHSFELLLSSVTQAPANGLRFSFQNIDATTGFPDGTQDQYRDVTSGIASSAWLVPPGPLTHDGTNGGTKRTVARGEYVGLVVEFTSWSSGDNLNLNPQWSLAAVLEHLNYIANGSTGTYVKNASVGIFGLKYDDGTYPVMPFFPVGVPAKAVQSYSFNTGSTPDERGLRFTVPTDTRIIGGWIRLGAAGACDAEAVLYDNADNVLATATLDADVRGTTLAINGMFFFGSDVELTAGDVYRLVLKPTTATSIAMYGLTLNAAAMQEAIPGGTSWELTTRTNAGAWTDTNTERPVMGILIDGIAAGAGGGGGAGSSFGFVG